MDKLLQFLINKAIVLLSFNNSSICFQVILTLLFRDKEKKVYDCMKTIDNK